MSNLNLTASDSNEQIVLTYLEANASDSLAERINAGTKTLKQCWNYIKAKAHEQANNGCACIEDKTVFGWAVHFFEEDSIKGEEFEKSSIGAAVKSSADKKPSDEVVAPEAPKPKQEKIKPKVTIVDAEQIGFDFFGG